MKLSTIFATTALVASSVAMTTASANDNDNPDLLIGITGDQIESLTSDEASETRGERVVVTYGYRPGMCGWRPCMKPLRATIYVKAGKTGGSSYYVKH